MVAWSFAASCASPAPVITRPTCAGVHSIFADTFVSQCALQSALISGGFTSPVHFGSLNSAVHLPVHVPSHFASALSSQLPPHLPLHSPLKVPPWHLPSQLPAHEAPPPAPVALPSHLPS